MTRRVLLVALIVALGVLVVVARRDEGPDIEAIQSCTQPAAAPAPAVSTGSEVTSVRAVEVGAVEGATALVPWVDGERLLVSQRSGQLSLLHPDGRVDRLLLDLADRTVLNAEGGLLGVAVAPDGDHLYLHLTDLEGTSQLLEYAIDADGVDAGSERRVLSQPHPGLVHNGGAVAFGPDGLLYVGFGDGGSHPEDARRAGSLERWDGKLLRIDPTGAADGDYAVPPDNPFVGDDEAKPEIWHTGLRNPYRFAFDEATGDLWIGDVGEACYEEINRVDVDASGIDFGFPAFEGRHEFFGGDPEAVRFPSVIFSHDVGCAVIAGVVSRDPALPDLDGSLLVSDFCMGGVRALRATTEGVEQRTVALDRDLAGVQAYGTGPQGEVYVLTIGGILRLEAAGAP